VAATVLICLVFLVLAGVGLLLDGLVRTGSGPITGIFVYSFVLFWLLSATGADFAGFCRNHPATISMAMEAAESQYFAARP
jgi:hypothetical protein